MARTVNPETQTTQKTPESGKLFDRVAFARENEAGVVPDDPEMLLYSDRVVETEGDPDPALERLDATGTADPVDFGRGVEENEVTITYSLQKPIVDEDGEPVDALYDVITRNDAWQIPNTHTMVGRDENPSPGPHDPEGCRGQRQYIVMKGGKADATIEPDAEEADPVPVELTYTAEKLRMFHIYQPADDEASIVAQSSSDADEGVELTIESEDGEESETVELNGEEPVATEAIFGDVDAFELSETCEGQVTLHVNEGGADAPEPGGLMAEIDGDEEYAQDDGFVEGDLGVPALGEGSYEEEVGVPFEDFGGDVFDFDMPRGAPAPDLNNLSVEIDNDLDPRPQDGTYRPSVESGNREITIESDVVGERATYDQVRSAYLNHEAEIGWHLSRTSFTFPESRNTEPPTPTRAPDGAFAETEGTWEPIGVTLEYTGSGDYLDA